MCIRDRESTGGHFHIESEPGVGTTVTAVFGLSHIDRMPLGDITSTIHNLIVYHPDTDFIYRYRYDGAEFTPVSYTHLDVYKRQIRS